MRVKVVLADVRAFPTSEEVIVSIAHFHNSKQEYGQCDLDNRAKTVLDALKEAVYADDRQVRMLWTHKYLDTKAQKSSYRISVKVLDDATIKTISGHVRRII